MYNTMRRDFYWQYLVNDVYVTTSEFPSRARDRRKTNKQRRLRLFSPSKPFAYVALDKLGLFPETDSQNQFIVVINGPYSKTTKVILTA